MINIIKEIEQLYLKKGNDINGEAIDPQVFQANMRISAVDEQELQAFESFFDISLPQTIQELYRYKNGSGTLEIFCLPEKQGFRLLPLAWIVELKMYLQNEDIEAPSTLDSHIQPYTSHHLWFPFATHDNASFLMLDFAPSKEGKVGQILEYQFETKEIQYVAADIASVVEDSLKELLSILK